MSELFTTIGGLIIAIGLAWCGLVLFQSTDNTGYAILGKAIALLPGLSVAGSGMVFLGIGGILGRLDRIAHNTFNATAALERTLGATRSASDQRREPTA